MYNIKLNNEERQFPGMMSVEKFNYALNVLGPKIVNSIMRISNHDFENFESMLMTYIEKNQNKTKDN